MVIIVTSSVLLDALKCKLMRHTRGVSAHLEIHHLGNALVSILLVIPDFMYLQIECSTLLIGSDRQQFLCSHALCILQATEQIMTPKHAQLQNKICVTSA